MSTERKTIEQLAAMTPAELLADHDADTEPGEMYTLAYGNLLAEALRTALAALPAGWRPLYKGCQLPPMNSEWGEWVVLLNNYGDSALEPRFGRLCCDDEGGLFWHLDNQEAWAFENYTHYLPLPVKPSAHDTVNRAALPPAPAESAAPVGAAPQWVAVSERLPEFPEGADSIECAVVSGDKVMFATYRRSPYAMTSSGRAPRWEKDNRIWRGRSITHWQPLPTPPHA